MNIYSSWITIQNIASNGDILTDSQTDHFLQTSYFLQCVAETLISVQQFCDQNNSTGMLPNLPFQILTTLISLVKSLQALFCSYFQVI